MIEPTNEEQLAEGAYPPPMSDLDEANARWLMNLFLDIDAATKLPKLGHWAAEIAHCAHHRVAELAGIEPVCPGGVVPRLSTLTEAELMTLHGLLSGEADNALATDGLDGFEDWMSQLLWMLMEELNARHSDRALFNAHAAAMEAAEAARERESRPAPDTSGIPPWSQVSGAPE